MLNGGYGVAYQGSDTSLHIYDARSNTSASLHLGMMSGTSPSFTRLVGTDSSADHDQANSGVLWTWSTTSGVQNLHIALKAGTSPSIVGLAAGGYEIAYQGSDGSLHVYSSITNTASSLHLGMHASTSPSIAAVPSSGFTVSDRVGQQRSVDVVERCRRARPQHGAAGGDEPERRGHHDGIPSGGNRQLGSAARGDDVRLDEHASHPVHRVEPKHRGPQQRHVRDRLRHAERRLHTYDATNGSINRHLGMAAARHPASPLTPRRCPGHRRTVASWREAARDAPRDDALHRDVHAQPRVERPHR